MKKITIYIVLAALCLNFSPIYAQSVPIIPLKIGDKVPEMTFKDVLQYKADSVSFSDFKGKLLILDFWGTWCAPCVMMIPKMDSLQRVFGNKVQFLSVTDEPKEKVATFMRKLEQQLRSKFNLPDVTQDNKLTRLFPHTYLPHYVWIDGDGVVKAATGFEEINGNNIRKALANEQLSVHTKNDPIKVPYDYKAAFLINNNGGKGEGLLFHSVLTKYVEGIGMGVVILPDSINMRISARNQPIEWLFREAYSEFRSEFLNENSSELQVANKELLNTQKVGDECLDWCRKGNAFCYEIIVLRAMKNLNAFKLMQEDLRRFFPQYIASVENRKTRCLLLQRTSKEDKIHSTAEKTNVAFDRFGWKVTRATLNLIIERLNLVGGYPHKIVNDTGYSGLVDISIDANLPDLAAVNRELEKYDLKLVEGDHESRMLVIRDSPATP